MDIIKVNEKNSYDIKSDKKAQMAARQYTHYSIPDASFKSRLSFLKVNTERTGRNPIFINREVSVILQNFMQNILSRFCPGNTLNFNRRKTEKKGKHTSLIFEKYDWQSR